MNKMYLVIGDWSKDGHNQSDKVLVETNKTVRQMQNAYKKSCKLTGISFNHNEDYTERDRAYQESGKYRVCCEYEGNTLIPECLEVLKAHNCPLEEIFGGCEVPDEEPYYVDNETFVDLWMWFVGLSMKKFEWKIPSEEENIPCINGYWGKLNVQFGYGLYY